MRNVSLQLQSHLLPAGLLPYAPRQPFKAYSRAALASAIALTRAWPEKMGILSHIVRDLDGSKAQPLPLESSVLEAHFDAVAVPAEVGNRLLELGFEPDGFARFVPAHFATHHTLKFKVDRGRGTRWPTLRAEMERRCALLIQEMENRWPDIDAYLEFEVYTPSSRRRWANAELAANWANELPFPPKALVLIQPPNTEGESKRLGLPVEIVKRGDIHIKIARSLSVSERESLIAALEDIGFYRVTTWAGNDVCTAQFANGGDARRCFTLFTDFFSKFGGSTELTMEPVVKVWRSRTSVGGETHLGSLPPLVIKLSDDIKKRSDCAQSQLG